MSNIHKAIATQVQAPGRQESGEAVHTCYRSISKDQQILRNKKPKQQKPSKQKSLLHNYFSVYFWHNHNTIITTKITDSLVASNRVQVSIPLHNHALIYVKTFSG